MKSVSALVIVLSLIGLLVYGVCHGLSSAYHWAVDTNAPQRAVDATGRKLDDVGRMTAPARTAIPKWIEDHD